MKKRIFNVHASAMALLLALTNGCGSDDASTNKGGSGSVKVIMSGEEIGTHGLLFPTGSGVTIADGWEIQFTHVLVTVGNVRLSENPDKAPSDQSQTDGAIATAAGPWAVDLHKEGSEAGAGGQSKAVAITTIDKKSDGKAFEADKRYAFGYKIQVASTSATKVNFGDDAEAVTLYDEMVTKGVSVLYVGTATFKGGTSCQSSDSTYDFGKFPTSVPFKLGFKTPVENINCQNQENQGDAFQGEEYQRGIPIKENAASTAQITFHLDHPLFSDVQHDPTLYFDQIAAPLVGKPAGTAVTLDDLAGV